MKQTRQWTHQWQHDFPSLLGLWLLSVICDRTWLQLDHTIPSWDEAGHLRRALDYWRVLQQPNWFSLDWWATFWGSSTKFPPLTYISSVPFFNTLGLSSDSAIVVNWLFSAVLVIAVYGLSAKLFSARVGLWAAAFCLLMPGLYRLRLDFLLDYPLTALVVLSFWSLTELSSRQPTRSRSWFWTIAFGLSFGLACLAKQTALLFLFFPTLMVAVRSLIRGQWERLLQLIGGLFLTGCVVWPWFRTSWLLILTSLQGPLIEAPLKEKEAPLNSLAAWLHYLKILPDTISWPLILIPIAGFVLYWRRSVVSAMGDYSPTSIAYRRSVYQARGRSILWLILFFVGGYVLSSLNLNKDARFVAPYLPILAILLAYGLSLLPQRSHVQFWSWRRRRSAGFPKIKLHWGTVTRWALVGLASLWMLLNLFPWVPGMALPLSSRYAQHQAYTGPQWPHSEIAQEVLNAAPFMASTIGVLPSTPQVNQHNVNLFGVLRNFQVYAREVGKKLKRVNLEVRSLNWFLTKTGDQGTVPTGEAWQALSKSVEENSAFQLARSWPLPDGSEAKLFRRKIPFIEVNQKKGTTGCNVSGVGCNNLQSPAPVQLTQVKVPDKLPPGKPAPVTYQWASTWQPLEQGLVLLTWKLEQAFLAEAKGQTRWFQDHGIGLGNLRSQEVINPVMGFEVIERLSMVPPSDLVAGTYTLEATYLDRQTRQTFPITVPPIRIVIDPSTPAVWTASEPDPLTQLYQLAQQFPKGPSVFSDLFGQVERLNQYNPGQDYLDQAEQVLDYRWNQEPATLTFGYGLALVQVLQRHVNRAIATFTQLVQRDPANPYVHAYLAVVNLYDWRASAAQNEIDRVAQLNPNLRELPLLKAVAALMQGRFTEAWEFGQIARTALKQKP